MTARRWDHETRLELAGKRQTVYNMIHRLHELRVANLAAEAELEHIDRRELKEILVELRQRGLVYSPKSGFVTCVD
jgi:hypothetical protein